MIRNALPFLVLLFGWNVATAQYSANDHIFRAQQWMDAAQPAAATAELDAALQLNPQEPRAYFNRGLCLLELGNLPAAHADFTKIIQLVPEDAEAWMLLADVNAQLGELALAEAAYERSYQLYPRPAALLARAEFYLTNDRPAAADQDFRRVLQNNPNHPAAHRGLGDLAQLREDYPTALNHYDRALRHDATDVTTWYNRAQANLAQGYHRAAALDLDRAAELAPENADVFALRARCRVASNAYAAETDARRARRLDKENGTAWYVLALLERQRGDHAMAMNHLDMSLLCEPENAEFRYERGEIAYNLGYYEAARLDWNEVVNLQPDHALAAERLTALRHMLSDRMDMLGGAAVPMVPAEELVSRGVDFVEDQFER